MKDLWRRLDVTVRDLPLALVLAIASLVPAFRGHGTEVGDLPDHAFDAAAFAVIALEALPLAVRRKWPILALTLVSLGFAVDQIRGYHTVAGTALPIALLTTAAYLEHHRRTVAILFSLAYVPLAIVLAHRGSGEGFSGFATFYLVLALGWGAGSWWRMSRSAEAARREHVAEATRVAERTRIARELHDVVTHHVTAMVVQTEAARYLTAAPERLDESLASVSETGRKAISDLRELLDVLNPEYRVPKIGELVEQTQRAGQPVEFSEEGSAEEGSTAEVTAYRVVQEALTNALKYAHGSHTAVHVRHGADEITVEIATEGETASGVGGSGRGLSGLHERVSTLGGEFTAGKKDDIGFVVRASIPTGRQK